MTQEEFIQKFEDYKDRYNYPEKIAIKGAISFAVRMCTTYPELAKEYYNSLPKATMD